MWCNENGLQGLDAVEPEGGVHERGAAQLHAARQRVAAAPVTAAARTRRTRSRPSDGRWNPNMLD